MTKRQTLTPEQQEALVRAAMRKLGHRGTATVRIYLKDVHHLDLDETRIKELSRTA